MTVAESSAHLLGHCDKGLRGCFHIFEALSVRCGVCLLPFPPKTDFLEILLLCFCSEVHFSAVNGEQLPREKSTLSPGRVLALLYCLEGPEQHLGPGYAVWQLGLEPFTGKLFGARLQRLKLQRLGGFIGAQQSGAVDEVSLRLGPLTADHLCNLQQLHEPSLGIVDRSEFDLRFLFPDEKCNGGCAALQYSHCVFLPPID